MSDISVAKLTEKERKYCLFSGVSKHQSDQSVHGDRSNSDPIEPGEPV